MSHQSPINQSTNQPTNPAMSDFVETYRNVIVQIATPNSTGTGFYLRDRGVVVTNHHVVEGHRSVVIEGTKFTKQLARVRYTDQKYDLAFLDAPTSEQEMPEVTLGTHRVIRERDKVTAIGHPFGLKFSVKGGIISNTREVMNGIPYLHIDAALNPGNSGGPLVNEEGEVVGINTFVIRDGDNTGFSLPVNFLHQTLEDYRKANSDNACRCASCMSIMTLELANKNLCSVCGSRIELPASVDEYMAAGVPRTIERIITQIGHDVALSRCGPDAWEIVQGSAKIFITYHEKSGLMSADAVLCQLPKEKIQDVYIYLLRQNYENEALTLSLHEQDIILSLLIYDRYLNEETGTTLLRDLFEKADYYDNKLVEEFGATWKEE
jgi:serine protease Do